MLASIYSPCQLWTREIMHVRPMTSSNSNFFTRKINPLLFCQDSPYMDDFVLIFLSWDCVTFLQNYFKTPYYPLLDLLKVQRVVKVQRVMKFRRIVRGGVKVFLNLSLRENPWQQVTSDFTEKSVIFHFQLRGYPNSLMPLKLLSLLVI